MERPGAKLVLIVDDDPDYRRTLARALAVAGFEVAEAGEGQEALAQLRGGLRPRLILLDLLMPVMDGWEFRGAQLADQELAEIPVLLMTAAQLDEDRIEAEGIYPKLAGLDRLMRAVALLCN